MTNGHNLWVKYGTRMVDCGRLRYLGRYLGKYLGKIIGRSGGLGTMDYGQLRDNDGACGLG